MSKSPIVEFKDFTFKYKSQLEPTLKNINLTIYEGEKVLILGPSGCGKSTLANCINGLIPFSYPGEIHGSCKIAGNETSHSSIFSLSSVVGTVLQDSDAQFVGLSVGGDIAYALENDNMPREEMLPRVLNSATLVGMQEFLEHVPYNLSGGQKQRVSLAGIMHEHVKILLFDEPLAALDPQMGNQAIDLIDKIQKNNNCTVIIIEHRLEDVLYRPVDRIILLEDGQIIADMKPNELLCSNIIVEKGIREPLYLQALKMAGCNVTIDDNPSNIFDIKLDKYKEKLVSYYSNVDTSKPYKEKKVVLNVKNVDFSYDKNKALDNVSFSINKGDKIAVIGKNGAGKSTMAKLICGILRPDKGEVHLEGVNYLNYSIKELGQKIGYVMQNPNQMLVKDIIKDEVSLGLVLNNKSEEEIEKNIEEALKKCDLWPMRNWPVSVVSYGQKKRVTIASILAMNPEIIILDEPTAGQDYRVYTEIMSFLEKLNKDFGITILFITHDMHLAIEYTDRAIVFADGKCIGDDSVFKILSDNDIIERASLKQTSLYSLATRLGINPESFIESFIVSERRKRHEKS
ncbi:MAG TPA: ABC transporter ATP-binding protein [Erysipelotrichaceae bacterium]|nr:ABC transporter ATP-binding protein [Erysipelotrichia bacterium]HPX31908.1 ABC transporter ATP-binding protein [Erysipelotrichaceae bacterium]HQA84420.1 ABC transporter ATP-binding protein [Erysipelotrichaceae bacterium]